MRVTILFLMLAGGAFCAQQIQFPPSFDKLAEKASETVEVTLDANTLKFASRFMNSQDKDEAKAKSIIQGLNGIWVRSFKFDKPGEYSAADIEAIRNQLKTPGWIPMVKVRSRKEGDNVDIFFRTSGENITGLLVLSAEPTELTVVNIDGKISPEDMEELGGQFGIPKIKTGEPAKSAPKGGAGKNDD